MCDYFAFRDKARATFPGLIVSVMMFEKGSGKGGEVTIYRLKVAGMAIGKDLTSEGASADEVLTAMVRKVGAARRVVKDAASARALARRAAAVQPQVPARMVATPGGKVTQTQEPVPQQMPLAA